LVYLLVLELFAKQKHYPLFTNHQPLALIAALFLAISPWHIQFSRGGWEVNTATFLMTAGILFFLKALRRPIYFILSSVFFVISLYTYHAARIVSPLIILGFIGIYWRDLLKNLSIVIATSLVGLICILPLIKDMTRSDILSRAAGVGLFADRGPVNRINEQRGEHTNYNGLTTKLIHNKYVNYSLSFIENWSAHYHGLFLFLSGDDIQRDKVPETGQMYMLDFLWLVFGGWWMLKSLGNKIPTEIEPEPKNDAKILNPINTNFFQNRQNDNRGIWFIIYWLIIAPFAAALTFQSPHALRAENMVIPLVIISAFGLFNLLKWLSKTVKNKKLLAAYYILLTTLIFWQFARYQHMYWIHMAKEYPYSSQYGVKELVEYVNQNRDKFNNVVVTTKYDQPYILFLFYTKYSPSVFQDNHLLSSKDQFGFSTVPSYDKYIFKTINWDEDRVMYTNSMIIGAPSEVPKEANIINRIYGSNGFEYFDIVAN
jgi:hypothetical protein